MSNINRKEFDKRVVVTWNWFCPSCSAYQTKYGSSFKGDDFVVCEACSQVFNIIEDDCDE